MLDDFFSSYETVETSDEILRIGRNFSKGSLPNTILIGHQDYIDIVVSLGSDNIYVLSGGEKALADAEQYPSIWEFLVGELDD